MKTKYSSLLGSAALILAIALTPVSSFAATSASASGHVQWWSHGMFTPIASWFSHFGARVALADTEDSVKNKAPSISGVSSPTVLKTGQDGTWTVHASDPENGSLSYSVDWGDQGMLKMFSLAQAEFTQTSTFTHAYSEAGTYTVKFTVKDDGGLSNTSTVTVHVVSAPEPLAFTDVNGAATNSTHATVSWMTNIKSDSTVFYSTETPVDITTESSKNGNAKVLNHHLNLNGLTPNTTYYFVVQSKDSAGEVVNSAESSFATPASPNGAPTIDSFTGPETLAVDTEGTWTVHASDPENGSLSYSVDWGDTEDMMARVAALFGFTQTSTFSHTYSKSGTYTVAVTATDDAGNSTSSSTTVEVTETQPTTPTLSNITALVGKNGITFAWNTDESADSEVYYSASSPVTIDGEGTTDVIDATEVTSHSINVGSLSGGTTYYFIIQSKDAEGDTNATSQFSLTTMSM